LLVAIASLHLVHAGGTIAAPPVQAQELDVRQVKAAYLYKFANYVQWPPGSFARDDSPLLIGVVGDHALADALQRMADGREVGGRSLQVRRLDPGDALGPLHIVFIGRMDRSAMAAVLARTRGRPMLVVSDTAGSLAIGSMVNFLMVDQRLRFEVALDPVARHHLKLSALMLTAAYSVTGQAR
jgi:hypothetical protein